MTENKSELSIEVGQTWFALPIVFKSLDAFALRFDPDGRILDCGLVPEHAVWEFYADA